MRVVHPKSRNAPSIGVEIAIEQYDPYAVMSMVEAGDASMSTQAVAIMMCWSIDGSGRNVRGCLKEGERDGDEFNDEPASDTDHPGHSRYQGG